MTDPILDRNGLEILDRARCLQLLASRHVGRVAVSVEALPVILPVNYAVWHDKVVFRTGEGTKLAAASRNAVLAFEVDDFDNLSHTGWSVLVTGRAREVTEPAAIDVLRSLPLEPWAHAARSSFVVLDGDRITGRRLGIG